MKTLFNTLLVGTLAMSAALSANICNCADPCGGTYAAGIDALYWKPVHCPVDYALEVADLDVFSVKADYDWGVRAHLSYENDCYFAQLSYLWFEANDTDSTGDQAVQSLITGIAGGAGARAKLGHEYQNVDLRLGYQACHGCCGSIDLFANARWAYVEQQLRSTVFEFQTGADEIARLRVDFNGGGLGVGATGRTRICGDLGFSGLFNVMAIIGRQRVPVSELVVPALGATQTYSYESNVYVVPALDLRLALDYSWQCGCADLVFELGYELNYLWGALGTPVSLLQPAIRRACQDIGFAGPFLGVTAHF